jgi:hypothetical protein
MAVRRGRPGNRPISPASIADAGNHAQAKTRNAESALVEPEGRRLQWVHMRSSESAYSLVSNIHGSVLARTACRVGVRARVR